GWQTHFQLIAQPDAIDVCLFDIGSYPQVIRIDQSKDRLTRIDHFSLARRAHVDNPFNRAADFRIGKPDVGALSLRGGGLTLTLSSPETVLLNGDLFRVRIGYGNSRALHFHLFLGRLNSRLRGVMARSSLIQLLNRRDAFL